MAADLDRLLELVPRDVEEIVRKTRDRTRALLQEALRSECRLVMRSPKEIENKSAGARVPVTVERGYPAALEEVQFRIPPPGLPLLTPYRSALRDVEQGSARLLRLIKELSEPVRKEVMNPETAQGINEALAFCKKCLGILNRNDAVIEILKVKKDVLGVYEIMPESPRRPFPHTDPDDLLVETIPNSARIRLYWAVIGLVGSLRGWDIEALTIVVLTHELAHAYTQLGADIDGHRWSARGFTASELHLKEGLAQYYTKRVLARLPRSLGGAAKVFDELLACQSEPYHAHEEWEEYTPEVIRSAMLRVRRNMEGSCIDEFAEYLREAKNQLKVAP